ncbi:murein L,D-transpeptidase [Hyphobacterium sp.]|uniref:L,D-transpeptidase family protein n=1 Tax=Hyphobacterium sp. TaxID=2004662 RepID=UPI003747DFE6
MRLVFILLVICLPSSAWAQSGQWTGPDRSGALESLVEVIADAGRHGLRPQDYHLNTLASADAAVASAAIDRLAEEAFRSFAQDLLTGRLDPHVIEQQWPFAARRGDVDAALARALETGDVAAVLAGFEPQTPAYQALIRERLFWLKQSDDDWPPVITSRDHLELGDSGADVDALRARLIQMGRLQPISPVVPIEAISTDFETIDATPGFDAEVQTAVRNVQMLARIHPDGIAGPATLAWINRTPSQRAETLRANLERLRWLPDDFGARHIAVNVPDFTLQVVEEGQVVRRHDVIVGRVSRPTPVLSATLAYMVVNPWWETPHRLAVNDELPLFRRDPDAVARLGFQILDRDGQVVDAATIDWTTVSAATFPYRLRQAPGPLNALGVVKLIFPNPHSTFLHDTPGRQRFDEMPRALSSGCVRVRDAVELAQWVADASLTEPADIAALVETRQETRLDVDTEIRVHFLYFTAFLDADASVRMVHDLYDKDPTILMAMDRSHENDQTRHSRPRPDGLHSARAGVGSGGDCAP